MIPEDTENLTRFITIETVVKEEPLKFTTGIRHQAHRASEWNTN